MFPCVLAFTTALVLFPSAFALSGTACLFKCDASTALPVVTQHWKYNTTTLWLTQAKDGACLDVQVW